MLNYDAKVLRNELEATEYDDFNIIVKRYQLPRSSERKIACATQRKIL